MDNARAIPYEGTDCTPDEAVAAVREVRARQMTTALSDHPHSDPGDGRTECDVCGKFVWEVTHSCKGVPVTPAAMARMEARHPKRCAICGDPLPCGRLIHHAGRPLA